MVPMCLDAELPRCAQIRAPTTASLFKIENLVCKDVKQSSDDDYLMMFLIFKDVDEVRFHCCNVDSE